jgi:hypothetical protein
MTKKLPLILAVSISLWCLFAVAVYFLPPVHERLAWRVDELILAVKYKLNPPAQVVFVPQEGGLATLDTAPTLQDAPTQALPTATWVEASPLPATAAPPTASPTVAPTPLPERVILSGVRYEDQHGRWNYCAPANLSMALSFWGWQGNRDVVGPVIKPDPKDKNVMPYEMVNYIEGHTDLSVKLRVGGDLNLLKRFIAAGFPVLVEKGTYLRDISGVVSWMGHYQVVTGYDDVAGVFIAQDSYVKPDLEVPYDQMIQRWRAFNYTYLIIHTADQESQVLELLGSDADVTVNYQNAALKASNEVLGLSGIDHYFAWFNRGTTLVALQDYGGAALAYDEAFKVYPTIPEDERPWRMLWYQTGPYFAYFYVQRYYDVLYLADSTLNAMQSDKNLEESYYWRGMAKKALGDATGAIADFRLALQFHPGFGPAIYQLELLGVTNP